MDCRLRDDRGNATRPPPPAQHGWIGHALGKADPDALGLQVFVHGGLPALTDDQIAAKPSAARRRFLTCTPSRDGSTRGGFSGLIFIVASLTPSRAATRRRKSSTPA